MIRSTELDQVFAALSAFQARVGAIPKTSTNPFFKSRYAALPDVVAVATPILTDCGLCVIQLLGDDDQVDTLTTIVGHKSGQFFGDTMHLRPMPDKDGKLTPQAQGSASTYGRRYSYMAALGLVADDDDDGNAASAPRRAPARTPAVRGDISSDVSPEPPPAAPPVPPMPAGLADQLLAEIRALGLTNAEVRMLLVETGAPSVPRSGSLEPVLRGLPEEQGAALTVRLGELRSGSLSGEAA